MQAITYGSVCSGIEAATTAWHTLGWSPRWFSEIEPFPSAVLAHHWPHVPNLGDFTLIRDRIAAGEVEAPDVLVGGTPCQAFSVAGLRRLMDDKRGQLTLEFVRLALALAGKKAKGGTLYVEGHTYACDPCLRAAQDAGIVEVVLGPVPADSCPDGPRYKSLGNSMAVPKMRWLGARIARQLEVRS